MSGNGLDAQQQQQQQQQQRRGEANNASPPSLVTLQMRPGAPIPPPSLPRLSPAELAAFHHLQQQQHRHLLPHLLHPPVPHPPVPHPPVPQPPVPQPPVQPPVPSSAAAAAAASLVHLPAVCPPTSRHQFPSGSQSVRFDTLPPLSSDFSFQQQQSPQRGNIGDAVYTPPFLLTCVVHQVLGIEPLTDPGVLSHLPNFAVAVPVRAVPSDPTCRGRRT